MALRTQAAQAALTPLAIELQRAVQSSTTALRPPQSSGSGTIASQAWRQPASSGVESEPTSDGAIASTAPSSMGQPMTGQASDTETSAPAPSTHESGKPCGQTPPSAGPPSVSGPSASASLPALPQPSSSATAPGSTMASDSPQGHLHGLMNCSDRVSRGCLRSPSPAC